jgi:hypothetical protein
LERRWKRQEKIESSKLKVEIRNYVNVKKKASKIKKEV